MAGISRKNGAVAERNTMHGGYQMTFLLCVGTNIGTADTGGGTSAIVEGNFTKAIRAIQGVATIVYVGDRNANKFVVAVDGATAQPTGKAYDSDATPTVTERVKAELEAAISGLTATVTDVSGLDVDLS